MVAAFQRHQNDVAETDDALMIGQAFTRYRKQPAEEGASGHRTGLRQSDGVSQCPWELL